EEGFLVLLAYGSGALLGRSGLATSRIEELLGRLCSGPQLGTNAGWRLSVLRDGVHLAAHFPKTLELVEERAPANAEGFGGLCAIKTIFVEGLKDCLALHVVEALGVESFGKREDGCGRIDRDFAQAGDKMLGKIELT